MEGIHSESLQTHSWSQHGFSKEHDSSNETLESTTIWPRHDVRILGRFCEITHLEYENTVCSDTAAMWCFQKWMLSYQPSSSLRGPVSPGVKAKTICSGLLHPATCFLCLISQSIHPHTLLQQTGVSCCGPETMQTCSIWPVHQLVPHLEHPLPDTHLAKARASCMPLLKGHLHTLGPV